MDLKSRLSYARANPAIRAGKRPEAAVVIHRVKDHPRGRADSTHRRFITVDRKLATVPMGSK